MHPSFRLANAATSRVHRPLIHFVGKRQWLSTPEPQHPHPQAPAELQHAFPDFLNKFKASGSVQHHQPSSSPSTASKDNIQVFTDFWQAPQKLWKRDLSEAEIEAIASGGASLS